MSRAMQHERARYDTARVIPCGVVYVAYVYVADDVQQRAMTPCSRCHAATLCLRLMSMRLSTRRDACCLICLSADMLRADMLMLTIDD